MQQVPETESQEIIPPSNRRKFIWAAIGGVVLVLLLGMMMSLGKRKTVPMEKPVDPDTLRRVTLGFVGDLMCHLPVVRSATLGPDSFDFRPAFRFIRPHIDRAEWLFGNLETVMAGNSIKYSGYPLFNSPDAYLDGLKAAGFDFLATVNNHSLDRSWHGLERTYRLLDSLKIPHTGTFVSSEDRDSIRIVNLKGIRMAVLGYSFGTNGNLIPKDKPWCINLIDSMLIEKDIRTARSKGAEIVMVYFHWGEENQRHPNAYQKRWAEFTVRSGADLIIACHPHVLQPVEKFKTVNATLDSGVIAWSLGNFLSNQTDRYCDAGAILYLDLEKNLKTGRIIMDSLSYLPTWVYRQYNPTEFKHYIFPSYTGTRDSFPSFFTPECKRKILQAHDDSRSIMTERMRIRER